MSIASVISSSSFVPSSKIFSAFACVGSVLAFVSPSPNWPFPLYPHVHTVPSAFNAAECVFPISNFGTVTLPSGTTCTNIVDVLCVIVCVTIISTVPIFFPCIVPSWSTVAISLFNVS